MPGRYGLTSSLYGPGPIISWYLTALSLVITWCFDSGGSSQAPIQVDLVALLLLPAVAMGDVLLKLHDPKVWTLDIGQTTLYAADSTIQQPDLVQKIAAIEACLATVEIGQVVCAVLFVTALWKAQLARTLVVASAGMLFYVSQYYVLEFGQGKFKYEPKSFELNSPMFSRLFLADSRARLVMVTALLGLRHLLILVTALSSLLSSDPKEHSEAKVSTDTDANTQESNDASATENHTLRSDSRSHRNNRIILSSALPIIVGGALANIIWLFITSLEEDLQSGDRRFRSKLSKHLHHTGRFFVPQTSASITDLDQAVAALAVGTVLGFSI